MQVTRGAECAVSKDGFPAECFMHIQWDYLTGFRFGANIPACQWLAQQKGVLPSPGAAAYFSGIGISDLLLDTRQALVIRSYCQGTTWP